jgi:hypothetical protein
MFAENEELRESFFSNKSRSRQETLERRVSRYTKDFMGRTQRAKIMMHRRTFLASQQHPIEEEKDGVSDSFEEFDIAELEDAQSRRKDPSSRSRMWCGKCCVLGPDTHTFMPRFATTLMCLTIVVVFSLTIVCFEARLWNVLSYITCALSLLTLLLMFIVMCSDPGIQSRHPS